MLAGEPGARCTLAACGQSHATGTAWRCSEAPQRIRQQPRRSPALWCSLAKRRQASGVKVVTLNFYFKFDRHLRSRAVLCNQDHHHSSMDSDCIKPAAGQYSLHDVGSAKGTGSSALPSRPICSLRLECNAVRLLCAALIHHGLMLCAHPRQVLVKIMNMAAPHSRSCCMCKSRLADTQPLSTDSISSQSANRCRR